jgi:hypothetical protein
MIESLRTLRISDHGERRNRRMANTETGAWRTPKPGMANADR